MASGYQAQDVNALMFSYLLNEDASGMAVPEVAAVVPTIANGGISPNEMTIRYRLRRDVRWSDGVPLTAHDVAFTFSALMNPRNNVGSTEGIDQIASVEAPDDSTVVVHMKRPYSPVLTTFLGPDDNYGILPRHLLAKLRSLNRATYNAQPVGSGPYKLERWDRGDRLVFVPNPYYFGAKPAIDELVLKIEPSQETIALQLSAGEVDGSMQLDAAVVPEVKILRGYRLAEVPGASFSMLSFNLNDAWLRDLRIRRAFTMAADWKSIVPRATRDLVDARDPTRALFSWADDPDAASPQYDPRAAGTLLDAAGWRLGTDGFRYQGGRPLEITLGYAAGRSDDERIVTQYQAALASIGVRLRLRAFSTMEFSAADGPLQGGRLQAAYWTTGPSIDPDNDWLLGCAQSAPRGMNVMHYCNRAVDAAEQAAVRTFDRAKRIALYRLVQRYVAHDLPFIPVYSGREFDITTARLRGFDPKVGGVPFKTVAQWSLR
jgi:peptide/nickel transport system substrate-binding protein